MDDEVRTALAARLAAARERVTAAALSAGRDPSDVTLLLASKTVDAPTVRAVLESALATDEPAPLPLLGENRVQELVAKAPELTDLRPTWHVIGPLQSNKVNAALRWASCVQSVETLALARRLAHRSHEHGRVLDVMVQVNVSGEPTKHGVHPDDALALALEVAALDGLRLTGLMTVGANSSDERLVRAGYARLRSLRDEVLDSGAPGTSDATGLSMGMSRDLEAAVDEGATIVRLGSAVFGPRVVAP